MSLLKRRKTADAAHDMILTRRRPVHRALAWVTHLRIIPGYDASMLLRWLRRIDYQAIRSGSTHVGFGKLLVHCGTARPKTVVSAMPGIQVMRWSTLSMI
jgi:hypothetical protein